MGRIMTFLNPANKKNALVKLSVCGLLFLSCGKKVNQKGDDNVTRTPSATSTVITLSTDGETNPNFYVVPDNGQVYIPEKLTYKGGNKFSAKLYINEGSNLEFYCDYVPRDDEFVFSKCTYENLPMSYGPGKRIDIYPNDMIRVEYSETILDVELEIDWRS